MSMIQELPAIEQLATEIVAGQISLSAAKSLIRRSKEDTQRRLAELRKKWQSLIETHAPNVQFRHALLELGVEAALTADSALDFLNLGLNLGLLLINEMDQLKRGIEMLEQSLAQTSVVKLKEDENAQVILVVADAYLSHHDRLGPEYLEVAAKGYEVALELSKISGDSLLIGRSHLGLGTALTEAKKDGFLINADQAIPHYLQALEHLTPDSNPYYWGLVENNIGNAYFRRPSGSRVDNLKEAAKHFRNALLVRDRKTNPHGFRITSDNLSLVYEELGQNRHAIECQRQIVASLDPIHQRNEFGRAQCSLAVRYRKAIPSAMSRSFLDHSHYVSQALACYHASLECFDKTRDIEEWATATSGLAAIYASHRHDYERAIALYREVLDTLDPDVHRKRFALIAFDFIQTCCVYAMRLNSEGQTMLAEEFVGEANEMLKRIEQNEALSPIRLRYLKARVLASLASITHDENTRLNMFGEIEDITRDVLDISAHSNIEAELVSMLQSLLINALIGQSRFEDARSILDDRLLYQEQLQPENPLITDLLGLFSRQETIYDRYIELSLEEGNTARALTYSDNSRARLLAVLVGADKQQSRDQLPEELRTRYKEVSCEFLSHRDKEGRDSAEYFQAQQLASELVGVFAEARRWRGSWAIGTESLVWAEDLSRDIVFSDRRTAIIEYWFRQDHARAFVLLPGDYSDIKSIPLESGHTRDLMRWIEEWFTKYGGFESVGLPALEPWVSSMDSICREIGNVYWAPLLGLLTEYAVERVVVVPDKLMSALPLHLGLVNVDSREKSACDLFEVSFVPSLSLLRWARRLERPAHGPILLFGNPIEECPINSCQDVCELHLPSALEQAELIKTLWPETYCLFGQDCNERNILEVAKSHRPGIIHAITHGATLFQDPLGSGLLIRLDKSKSDDPLGLYLDHYLKPSWIDKAVGQIFTLDTIMHGMDLDGCCLAILSACEVGLSPIHGSRENLSVAGGFLAAGVPSIVAPLWPTLEAATKLLMDRFYLNLRRFPSQKAYALSEAQKWLRDLPYTEARSLASSDDLDAAASLSGKDFPFSHPFLWGAFQLLGSPL